MKPPKCRLCGHEHALGGEHVFSPTPSRVTPEAPAVEKKKAPRASAKRAAVRPEVKPVKPLATSVKPKTWRERDPVAYRAYMRGYMARRRAARRNSAGVA